MSAIDDLLSRIVDLYDGRTHLGKEVRIAQSDLAALRAERDALWARVTELEQARQFQHGMIDGLNVAIAIKDDKIENLQDCTAMLTPRRCRTCAKLEHDALLDIVKLGADSHVAFDGERWREMFKVACAALEHWRICSNCNSLAPDEVSA